MMTSVAEVMTRYSVQLMMTMCHVLLMMSFAASMMSLTGKRMSCGDDELMMMYVVEMMYVV